MRGSSSWRRTHFGAACSTTTTTITDWMPGVSITVDARAEQAFRALARVFTAHGYVVRKKDTGAYNCRRIKGSTAWSSHAWGLAVDVNWNTNPYVRTLRTDMPKAMREDALKIHTATSKQRVFKWGGDWDNRPETNHSFYDAMHWEIYATPRELSEGLIIPSLPDDQEDEDMIRKGDPKSSLAAKWMSLLDIAFGGGALPSSEKADSDFPWEGPGGRKYDGVPGSEFETITKRWQTAAGLPQTGEVGPAEWAAMYTIRHAKAQVHPHPGGDYASSDHTHEARVTLT